MKKVISIFLVGCMLLFSMTAMAEELNTVEKIKISVKNTTMEVGSTQKINVTVEPSSAAECSFEYSSDNPDVVTAAIGTLIANREGTANITVTVAGTEISDTIQISVGKTTEPGNPTVPDDTVLISEIIPRDRTVYIERYDEERIFYDVQPSNAVNKNVTFESANTSIATVDDKGYVYGRRKGNTTIRITSEDGKVSASVKVYVTEYDNEYDNTSSPTLRSISIMYKDKEVKDNFEVMEKETVAFSIDVSPASAGKSVKWRSSDEDIATVDDNGKVTGVHTGTCKIYATSRVNSSRRDTVTIKVTKYVRYPDRISLSFAPETVFETGNTVQFTPIFYPEDTTERTVKWQVSGNGKIDQNGHLEIYDRGEITVKVYSANWKQSAEYTFTASYSRDHFSTIGETFNVMPDRAIEISFDADVNIASAMDNIFASTDQSGNGEKLELNVLADKSCISVRPVGEWPKGMVYIFIKEKLSDVNGIQIGKSLRYKFNVRGAKGEV